MFDCGIHPGLTGMASLPFFDEVDLETVDAILVTHFHLDHCAALPYVVGRTAFKGRVFMTHATKAVVATLLRDFVRVSRSSGGGNGGDALYDDAPLHARHALPSADAAKPVAHAVHDGARHPTDVVRSQVAAVSE